MSDLTDAQVARLNQNVDTGAMIRSFCQHPGFKIYKQELEDIISDKKNAWLKGTDEDARIERIRAQGVQLALDKLKALVLQGDQAQQILQDNPR